ncbi:hypothetical protein [Rhodoferax sp.]|uniref:hypothetical protein n=1 Tax=Rhodoferax sp. TaxID=50421 RepID=UPI00374DB254
MHHVPFVVFVEPAWPVLLGIQIDERELPRANPLLGLQLNDCIAPPVVAPLPFQVGSNSLRASYPPAYHFVLALERVRDDLGSAFELDTSFGRMG